MPRTKVTLYRVFPQGDGTPKVWEIEAEVAALRQQLEEAWEQVDGG